MSRNGVYKAGEIVAAVRSLSLTRSSGATENTIELLHGAKLLAVVCLFSCATSPPPEPTFESALIIVRILDEKAFNRGLQAAMRDGFKPVSVDAAGGFFSVERTLVDQRQTAKKLEERISVRGTPHTYSRRLTITVVVGEGEATIASSVVGCVDAKCGGAMSQALNRREHQSLYGIVSAFEPPTQTNLAPVD